MKGNTKEWKNWANESGERNEKEQNKWISKQERNIINESTMKGSKGHEKKNNNVHKDKKKIKELIGH